MSGPFQPLTEALSNVGFDLAAATTVQAYNASVSGEYALPDFGRSNTMAVVIGNTAALWPHLGKIWDNADYRDDPVDTYTTVQISAAVSAVGVRSEIRYSFDPPPKLVAIQKLANVAGLAWLSPSHLCVHPTYGPWIALRAAVVFDVDGPTTAPAQAPCDCSAGCLPAFREALAAGQATTKADIEKHWRLWVAFRDACPVGRDHRYSDEQVRYHYTEDPTARPPLPSRT